METPSQDLSKINKLSGIMNKDKGQFVVLGGVNMLQEEEHA